MSGQSLLPVSGARVPSHTSQRGILAPEGGAHSDGIRFENAINGTAPNGRYEDWQPSPAGTIRIPIVRTVNGVVTPQIITITLHNGNFGPSDISNNVQ